ncbi:MAG: polysaccharide biosynthesis/export family protein [Bacteroidales bacterium]|nr:polysaccharide biosynthesis/export family protein [Bacteroidales bacterium]
MKRHIILFVSMILLLNSCKVFMPTRMLRATKSQIQPFPQEERYTEYKIAPNDILQISVDLQEGEAIFENSGNNGSNYNSGNYGRPFTVEFDGMVKLPRLGRIQVAGLTTRQLEDTLELAYSQYMNSPMVRVKITNHRVTIFPGGEGGTAKVITLNQENTTLIEALAQAGGITDGRACKIRLIRGDLKDPIVYQVDLSTIDGMKKANLTLKANDIIYVEPRLKPVTRLLRELNPYITLLSNTLLIINSVKQFKNIND